MELLSLSIFGSYFSIITLLFGAILRSLPWARFSGRAYVFTGLTLASFGHTWYYMFKFMAWSFVDYEQTKGGAATHADTLERISAWLTDTSLFEQAWARVCLGQMNWWWSQQLCLFTVGAWTIFLATEGNRHQVRRLWAYMLLGQLVAISVASNLFYLALVLAPPPTRQLARWASPALWIPVIISLATVALSPLTDDKMFLPNLLVMHAAIVFPFLIPSSKTLISDRARKPAFSMPVSTLYLLVFLMSLSLHTRTTANSLSGSSVLQFVRDAWSTLYAHPAQSSIGWDVIWTSISFVVWLVLLPDQESSWSWVLTVVYLVVTTPLVSVGVLAPHILRPQEEERDEKKDE